MASSRALFNHLIGKKVVVKLKGAAEYRGVLVAVDHNLNLHLSQAKEYHHGQYQGTVGDVLVSFKDYVYVKEMVKEGHTEEGEAEGSEEGEFIPPDAEDDEMDEL